VYVVRQLCACCVYVLCTFCVLRMHVVCMLCACCVYVVSMSCVCCKCVVFNYGFLSSLCCSVAFALSVFPDESVLSRTCIRDRTDRLEKTHTDAKAAVHLIQNARIDITHRIVL